MKDSKIFYAIQRLSKVERTRFLRYLESPYFNTDSNLTSLYQEIVKEEDAIEADKLSKPQLWERVRQDTPYNDPRFRKYSSDLLKHLEGFLYQEYTRQDKGHEYPFVLDALNERRMEKLYDSVLRGGRDAIQKVPQRDSRHFQRVYAMEKRFYDLSDSERRRGVAATTTDIADALDIFYIIEKLRLYCSVLVRSFYLKSEYEIRLIEEMLLLVEKSDMLGQPAIEIYYRMIQTYKQPDNFDNYFALKTLVVANHELFSPDELVEIYNGLLNYQARGINRGIEGCSAELVNLCDTMLKQKVYNSQGEISPWMFRNGIVVALRNDQFDWVENVLDTYSERLPASYRDNAISFNYAQLYFYRKEYGKVLDYLQMVEYQDPTYALNSRNLLVAVYYELGQIDPLYSTIHAFRTYIKRQTQLSEKVRIGYRDLLKVTAKLAKATKKDHRDLSKIEKFLDDNPSTVSMQWLTTKLQELRDGKRHW